jgi:hypothetical protein
VAINRRYAIAIDDSRAIRRVIREVGAKLEIVTTIDVMITLIRLSVLDIDAADRSLASSNQVVP